MTTGYVYIESEPGLWTVGFYDPSGKWQAESDQDTRQDAAARVHYLNGGAPEQTECDRQQCTYYQHYLVHYNPELNGPKLEHSAYHSAEKLCETAQNEYIAWMDEHPDLNPDHNWLAQRLSAKAEKWERRVCA
jgi:hypothetical protein